MEERNVATWEEFIEGLSEVRRERASSTDYVQELEETNLNAFSLFGSDESLMETLAAREFDLP